MKATKRNRPSTPLILRPWFMPLAYGLLLAGAVGATLVATGDPRCLVVKCVVVK